MNNQDEHAGKARQTRVFGLVVPVGPSARFCRVFPFSRAPTAALLGMPHKPRYASQIDWTSEMEDTIYVIISLFWLCFFWALGPAGVKMFGRFNVFPSWV